VNYFKKNSSTLELIKWLSILSMLIDHMGLLLFDDNIYMRAIGRFALIGFSFLLAYNYRYNTHDKAAYKKRLLIWGLISQVPYSLAFGYEAGINIMFLLFMGLVAIEQLNTIYKTNKTIIPSLILTFITIASYFTGYFLFGVLTIALFYFALESKISIVLLMISAALLNFSIVFGLAAVGSIFVIYYLNTTLKMKRLKGYYFYLFYPLHLLILAIINISV